MIFGINQPINYPNILHSKLEFDLYRIKAQIDLKCLNYSINNENCSINDYNGNKYIKENNEFKSKIPFEPYGLKISN